MGKKMWGSVSWEGNRKIFVWRFHCHWVSLERHWSSQLSMRALLVL